MRLFRPLRAIPAAIAAAERALASPFGVQELMLLAGLGLAGYGAWLVYAPAGFLLPGAVLVYVAIAGLS